jgi:hypothetical protein
MELNFTKKGNKWVTTTEIVDDFALHIEKGKGELMVKQSHVAGGTPDATTLNMKQTDSVLDTAIQALIYPLYITIEAETAVAPRAWVLYSAVTAEAVQTAITDVLNTPV